MKYSIFIYIYFQILLSIQNVLTNNEPQIAFFCGRPANIFKNNKWTLDYQQDCLKDEESIVEYCQNIFPKLNILTAEPAVQKIKFKNWCDFNKQNCEVDVEIRPFKCLDKDFLSDALLLPRHCQFGHLFNQSGCLNYKTWVERATAQCIKQDDWTIKSYGMLFACGDDNKIIKPMFFKGVEFVCCPKFTPEVYNEEADVSFYKNYLSNAVLETEQGEQNIYENAEKTLIKAKNAKEMNVINNFKESENNLKNLWKTNPAKAKEKENNLISNFKAVFAEVQAKFLKNKKQLFNYHDERLEFIFNAKLKAAKETLMKMEDKTETEIYESMKNVLTIILNRKKYLLAELGEAMKIKDNLADKISKKIDSIEKQFNEFFSQINKQSLKNKLMEYLTAIYPDSSKSIKLKDSIYNDQENGGTDPKEIIKKYKHQTDGPKYDDSVIVHYDLGLNDLDQLNHYSQHEHRPNGIGNQFIKRNDSKTLLGIIFGVLASVVLVLIIGSGFIVYQQKKRTSGYSNPHFSDDNRKKIYGFGGFNAEKNFTDNRANGYENLTYMAASHLGKSVDMSQMDTSQSNDGDDEKSQIPLIN